MRKNMLHGLIIVIAVITIILSAFSVYVVAIEKRSIMSKVVELFLKASYGKKTFTDKEDLKKFLEERKIENEKLYIRPSSIKLNASIEELLFEDMQVFIITPEDGQKNIKTNIFYLHGGSYVHNPDPVHWKMFDKLIKQTSARIIIPIYPKAPNYNYKQSFKKVLDYYSFVFKETDGKEIVLMGDSAGGGFALAAAQILRNLKLPLPRDIILISPWLDISMKTEGIRELEKKDPMLSAKKLIDLGKVWAANDNPKNFMLSPINGNFENIGHITLFIGTHEIFLPDAEKFKSITESKNIKITYYKYHKMNHVFPLFPIPEAKDALEKIAKIINGSNSDIE